MARISDFFPNLFGLGELFGQQSLPFRCPVSAAARVQAWDELAMNVLKAADWT